MLRCKRRDLALVIAGASSDVGQMVTCLELLPAGWQRDDMPPRIRQQIAPELGPLWPVDRPLRWGDTGAISLYLPPDKALMPIRPEPTQDNTEERDCEVLCLEPPWSVAHANCALSEP